MEIWPEKVQLKKSTYICWPTIGIVLTIDSRECLIYFPHACWAARARTSAEIHFFDESMVGSGHLFRKNICWDHSMRQIGDKSFPSILPARSCWQIQANIFHIHAPIGGPPLPQSYVYKFANIRVCSAANRKQSQTLHEWRCANVLGQQDFLFMFVFGFMIKVMVKRWHVPSACWRKVVPAWVLKGNKLGSFVPVRANHCGLKNNE